MIINVAVPVVAVGLAVSVSTLEPVMGFGLNEAVTPLGSPGIVSGTLPGDPSAKVIVTLALPEAPWAMARVVGEIESEMLGVRTVTDTFVLAVREPELPVMVRLYVPGIAELSVAVSTLVPVVGFGLNDAVIPLGTPVAASVTLPLKPEAPLTVIEVAAGAPG